MTKWKRVKQVLDWLSHIHTIIWILAALGVGSVIRAIAHGHIPDIWLMPIWLLSSAAILALISWIARIITGQGKPKTWCDDMAADDAKRLTERLAMVRCDPVFYLTANEPYIDFKLTFVNATIFYIQSEQLEGDTYYERSPLAQRPKLVETPLMLRHGDKRWVIVRQHVTKEVAEKINLADDGVKFDFSRLHITFSVTGQSAPEKFVWHGLDDVIVKRPVD